MKKSPIKPKGAIALVTAIILGAAIAVMALGILALGISARVNAFNLAESEKTFIRTEGCMEETLIRLKRDNTFAGGTIFVEGLLCNVNIEGGGDTRDVSITGENGNFFSDIDLAVQITPVFGIITYKEQK
jgi:hypothetical protein